MLSYFRAFELFHGYACHELAPHAERLSPRPRIYADANVPAGVVAYMRARLEWDVLFVMEDDGLRRAPDARHYRLAQQLRRTLITLDRDYLDDRRFPPAEGCGVLVINAPDERLLASLLAADRSRVLPPVRRRRRESSTALPLAGRKMQVHTDWGRSYGEDFNRMAHDSHRPAMIVLSGADLVLPDRMVSPGTIVIDGARIVDIRSGAAGGGHSHPPFAFYNHYIVPGFIDVHVHGVNGVDVLDGADSVRTVAARAAPLRRHRLLPDHGCVRSRGAAPDAAIRCGTCARCRRRRGARVLPAHLESNFINPAYHGAQPLGCLRSSG